MRSCGVVLTRSFFAAARRIVVETIFAAHPTPARVSLRSTRADPPPSGEGEVERNFKLYASVASYTAAVVTPPSTTMVCPVMKVDASEAR